MNIYSKYIKISAICIIILVIGLLIFAFFNKSTTSEDFETYTPAKEISDEELRKTNIVLYFISKENGEIKKEERLIDSKLLISNPAQTLLDELFKGSKFNDCMAPIPDETKINNVIIEKNVAIVDLSTEFITNSMENGQFDSKYIECIVNTLTQLNEVNSVKFLIDGSSEVQTKSGINLTDVFIKND